MIERYRGSHNSFFKWSDSRELKQDKNGNWFRSYGIRCESCQSPINIIIYDKKDNEDEVNKTNDQVE